MAIAAVVGSGLGLAVWHLRPGAGETLLWGVTYATLFWFIGPLTLRPLILGGGPAWDAQAAQAAFASLLGHVVYGAGTALAIVVLHNGGVSAGRAWRRSRRRRC